MADLVRISMSLERELCKRFDRHLRAKGYPIRSEAMKALMRNSLVEQEWAGNEEVAGAVAMVYDHHRKGVVQKMIDVQHEFGAAIVSTQHVHLDHHNCLEIVVVRGRAADIEKLAAALRSAKGIKHSSLVMTSVGGNLG